MKIVITGISDLYGFYNQIDNLIYKPFLTNHCNLFKDVC